MEFSSKSLMQLYNSKRSGIELQSNRIEFHCHFQLHIHELLYTIHKNSIYVRTIRLQKGTTIIVRNMRMIKSLEGACAICFQFNSKKFIRILRIHHLLTKKEQKKIEISI